MQNLLAQKSWNAGLMPNQVRFFMAISRREPAPSELVGCASFEASFWAAFHHQKEASWPEKRTDYLGAEALDFRFVGSLGAAEIPLAHSFK
ncbi:hypothetical protein [Alcaligenes faecalis]|uniref:hypothetical protein n=1 Tax=Alcaligenes faecalis TaxID=511 RepID=UPI001D17C32F|nr:hypothetical protein [Alcaligenes faecalis]